jgi:hypothetical protein
VQVAPLQLVAVEEYGFKAAGGSFFYTAALVFYN